MVIQIDAQSQPQRTWANKEERRGGSHGGRGKRIGRASQKLQSQPLPLIGDDRKEADTLSATGSGDTGEIIEQLISQSLSQAKQHEDTAVILREQAQKLKEVLSTLNQTNNE